MPINSTTHLMLKARTFSASSVPMFFRPHVRKWVCPIWALSVPNWCSTVQQRRVTGTASPPSPSRIALMRCSCYHRMIRRSFPLVHRCRTARADIHWYNGGRPVTRPPRMCKRWLTFASLKVLAPDNGYLQVFLLAKIPTSYWIQGGHPLSLHCEKSVACSGRGIARPGRSDRRKINGLTEHATGSGNLRADLHVRMLGSTATSSCQRLKIAISRRENGHLNGPFSAGQIARFGDLT